jgi:hypothetical protein
MNKATAMFLIDFTACYAFMILAVYYFVVLTNNMGLGGIGQP